MKSISTLQYARLVLAQQFYDPDQPEGVGDLQTEELPLPEQENLPVLKEEDLEGLLEDQYDEQELPQEEEPPDIPIPEEEYPEFPTTEEAVNWAQQNHESIRIYYTTRGGRDIKRDVEPHGQFLAKTTGNRILVTFDRTVGDIRAFIVDNIMYHMFSGEEFEPKFIVQPSRGLK